MSYLQQSYRQQETQAKNICTKRTTQCPHTLVGYSVDVGPHYQMQNWCLLLAYLKSLQKQAQNNHRSPFQAPSKMEDQQSATLENLLHTNNKHTPKKPNKSFQTFRA
jgi:hypothetical protein